jgi:Mn2+/Fe2+ NRAMP family transporter
MGLILTTTAGLALWIVLWAVGVKSFDAFLITLGLIVLAATVRMIMPALPGKRPSPDEPS